MGLGAPLYQFDNLKSSRRAHSLCARPHAAHACCKGVGMTDNPLGVVRGAAAIAKAVGLKPRRAYYLLERGLLPARKEGATWTTTIDRLRRFYEYEEENGNGR